jgi:hypothetical protein
VFSGQQVPSEQLPLQHSSLLHELVSTRQQTPPTQLPWQQSASFWQLSPKPGWQQFPGPPLEQPPLQQSEAAPQASRSPRQPASISQLPPEHVPAHALPQAPQLAAFVCRLTQRTPAGPGQAP